MILEDVRFPTNTELTFAIPCYHGMKTPLAGDHKHDFGGYQIWYAFTYGDSFGIKDHKLSEAYNILFGDLEKHCKFDTGYNDWESGQDVYFFRISGGRWNNHQRIGYNREYLRENAHSFMEVMCDGVADGATGDDGYFDDVPSEYDAIRHLIFDLNTNFETTEFTQYAQGIWDAIRNREEGDEMPIEFIETYGERP